MRRRGIVPREALGQGMGPLTARACFLARALADRFTLNDSLIEVFPAPLSSCLVFATATRSGRQTHRDSGPTT